MCREYGCCESSHSAFVRQLEFSLVLGREGMVGGRSWVCWLLDVAEVGRMQDAQGTLVSGENGSAEGRTLGKSKGRDGCEEKLMEQLEANVD